MGKTSAAQHKIYLAGVQQLKVYCKNLGIPQCRTREEFIEKILEETCHKKLVDLQAKARKSTNLKDVKHKSKDDLIFHLIEGEGIVDRTAAAAAVKRKANDQRSTVKRKRVSNDRTAAVKRKANDVKKTSDDNSTIEPRYLNMARYIQRADKEGKTKDEIAAMVVEELHSKLIPVKRKSAVNGFFNTYSVEPPVEKVDPKRFMALAKEEVLVLIRKHVGGGKAKKIQLILHCVMARIDASTGERMELKPYFNSKFETVYQEDELPAIYEVMKDKMLEAMVNFHNKGSNWTFEKVMNLVINVDRHDPLNASSYVRLPYFLEKKKALINVDNKGDGLCFKWAVTSGLYPVGKNANRRAKYVETSKNLDWTGVPFPTRLEDIKRFEDRNPTVAVNVLGCDEMKRKITTLQPSRTNGERERTINLLLISENDGQHYCWIKDLSRLLSKQINNHKGERHFCLNCLNSFHSKESLRHHQEYCNKNECVNVEMPKPNTFLNFYNHNRRLRVPFVVYADFECFTTKIDRRQPEEEDATKSYTEKYQMHVPSGYCYYVKCSFDDRHSSGPFTYTKRSEEDDVARTFVKDLESKIQTLYDEFKKPKDMIITREQRNEFRTSVECHICRRPFDNNDQKVTDHDHYTGLFRGAAHNKCNLEFRDAQFYPVLFHNLSGYDGHLFVKDMGATEGELSCIAQGDEKYISFTKWKDVDEKTVDGSTVPIRRAIRFLDSYKFLSQSLETLVGGLEKEEFKITRDHFNREQVDAVLRKGVYPYDYMNEFAKFDDDKLPAIEDFHSKLYQSDISAKDYERAQNVWKLFDVKSMREYHDLYLKTDVLLLADVFENFRRMCLEHYELDPAWYYTTPGLGWDALLKTTGVRLELLSDVDMLLMFEKGVRGGVSMISHRYSKANNPYVGDFDSERPSKYVQYWDANNLYGWAMSHPLPTGNFEWVEKSEERQQWRDYPCILEVDLVYPFELHDSHNDYPMAPERMEVNGVEKLIPNLNDKRKYVVYCENLKQYVARGMRLVEIHRVIRFDESAWMKPYIDLNTHLRTKGKGAFEKDFFKLMNNCVYGKSMENIRNRTDIRLVTSEVRSRKYVSKPNFKHRTVFDENLVAVHMGKTHLKFDKPSYLGTIILDVSKQLMYDFHYDYVKAKFGSKAKLLFTDTDSLAYEIETGDVYADITPDVDEWFDTSNYPVDHPSKIPTGVNEKALGKFKDECGGRQIVEFVGLRPKLYAFLTLKSKEDVEREREERYEESVERHMRERVEREIEKGNEKSKADIERELIERDKEYIEREIEQRVERELIEKGNVKSKADITTEEFEKCIEIARCEIEKGKEDIAIEKYIENKRCKGIQTCVTKGNITFDDYKECLFEGVTVYKKTNTIRSEKHQLYTEIINKIALTSDDDKRIICDDKISTNAIGHYAAAMFTNDEIMEVEND